MKKRIIPVLALLLSLCMLFAACSPAETAAPTPDGSEATAAPEAQPTEAPAQPTEAPEETQEPEEEPAKTYPTREAALPFTYPREAKNNAADEANAPKVTVLDNGVKSQRTPYNTVYADGKVVTSWNNLYMNADNRGCNVCHTLEDAVENMDTYHGIIYMGYETEQTLANCFGCHGFYITKLKDSIHTLHLNSTAFNQMNGNCESCHYINSDGEFERWDYVKYDVLFGIKELPAESVTSTFDWNQTEITPVDKMFFKSIKSAPETWLTDDSQITPDIYENWTIKVHGDMDNPFEMTLGEMVEKFGTETHVMKAHCVVNGPGEAMIYQAEVTGIPLSKILEYAQVHDDANMLYPIGDDGYCYNVYTQTALDENALIVTEMNGQPMPADQGYPCSFWCYEMSCGNFTKRVIELKVVKSEDSSWDFYGDFVDPTTGEPFDKPNIGVLNATNGQIFAADEPVHLEGYADAWNEPITKIEFSFDHGATWIEQPIDNSTSKQWVYWNYDISGLEPGSYLIKLRATSLKDDGTERVNNTLTNFFFNVE